MPEKAKDWWRFDPNRLTTRDVLKVVPMVVAVFVVVAVFASHVSHDVYIKWGGLGLDTAGIFAFFTYYSRKFLGVRRFWFLTAALLAVHIAAWIVLLSHVGEWRLAWFSIMVFEFPAFLYLRDWPGFLD